MSLGRGGEVGVRVAQQQRNKNVVVFTFIVVKNVISSQVTGLFSFDTFYTNIVKLFHD